MIEIKYTRDEIFLKMDDYLSDYSVGYAFKLLDKVKEVGDAIKPISSFPNGLMVNSNAPVVPYASNQEYRDIVRERLPNNGVAPLNNNFVDVTKTTLDKPNYQRHTHFRCSHCGQSAVTVVNETVILRDLESKEDNLCILTGADLEKFNYEEAKEHVSEVGVCLVTDGQTKGFCPKCLSENLLELWIDAYENPLKYFECETPCPLCGFETVISIDGSQGDVIKCDSNSCGYVLKEVK